MRNYIETVLFGFWCQIIAVNDVICVRGYWNTPEDKDASKDHLLNWFNSQIQKTGFFDLKDMLYFPQCSGKMFSFSLKKVKEPQLYSLSSNK